tara:strand:+ start:253 stop:507 length:255 start_codon:yes stop_codon:yes gene_type:complete
MAGLVSPCCGSDYDNNEDGPSYCCDAPILQGICSQCKDHAEPAEGYICERCDDFFEEPIKDYEYSEHMKESNLEDRMDEKKLKL